MEEKYLRLKKQLEQRDAKCTDDEFMRKKQDIVEETENAVVAGSRIAVQTCFSP